MLVTSPFQNTLHMDICIPLNEANWESFYYKAKYANVSIKSRFEGVIAVLHRSTRLPSFLARYYDHRGNRKDLGYFPLTREGEEAARAAYEEYLQRVNRRKRPKIVTSLSA